MKKLTAAIAGLLIGGLVQAENLEGVDEFVCAATQVQICIEDDTCYTSAPWELDMPDFVVIDISKKTVSTTKASKRNRSTKFTSVSRDDGLIYLQGIEGGRAFSFVIHEATGRMTVAVSRDGLSVSVFGACTDTNL
jgi:hypothetical protein